MSKYQVGATPEPIFPDGLNQPLSITNDGPFTVYLDTVTSVSANHSMPLLPTATVGWDAGNPLFMVADGETSSVRVDRNSQASDANRAGVYALLATLPTTNYAFSSTVRTLFSGIPVSAFNSVVFELTHDFDTINRAGTQPTTNDFITIRFSWYTDSGIYLSGDVFNIAPIVVVDGTTGNTIPVRIIAPIKGQTLTVTMHALSGVGSNNFNASALIFGTDRILPYGVERYWEYPAYDNGSSGNIFDPNYGSDYYGDASWDFGDTFLTSMFNTVQVSVRTSASVTTLGNVLLRDGFNNTKVMGRLDIPVASGVQDYITEWKLAKNQPLKISGTAPLPGTVSNRLTLNFVNV